MALWVVGSVVAVAMLVVVVVALWRGRTLPDPSVPTPVWGLPTPSQVQHGPFPVRWQGYDPDHVDAHLAAAADAYAALYQRADPDTRRMLDDRLRRARAALEADVPPELRDTGPDPSTVVVPKVRHEGDPAPDDEQGTGDGVS